MSIHFTESVTIERSPKDVSEFMADLSNETKYWEGVKSMTLLSGKAGEVGARYERVFEAMGKDNKAVIQIQEHEVGKRTVVQSDPGPVTVKGSMTYEAVPGGTRISLTIEGQAHGMAKLFSHKIRKGMEENTRASLARLKQVLESQKPATAAKTPSNSRK